MDYGIGFGQVFPDPDKVAKHLLREAGYDTSRPIRTNLGELIRRLGGETQQISLEAARKAGIFCRKIEDAWGAISFGKPPGKRFTVWLVTTASRPKLDPLRVPHIEGHELGEFYLSSFVFGGKSPILKPEYMTSQQEAMDWLDRARDAWCDRFVYHILLDPDAFGKDMRVLPVFSLRRKYGLSWADTLFALVELANTPLAGLEFLPNRSLNKGSQDPGVAQPASENAPWELGAQKIFLPADDARTKEHVGKDRLSPRASWNVKLCFDLLRDDLVDQFRTLLNEASSSAQPLPGRFIHSFTFPLTISLDCMTVNTYQSFSRNGKTYVLLGRRSDINLGGLDRLFYVDRNLGEMPPLAALQQQVEQYVHNLQHGRR